MRAGKSTKAISSVIAMIMLLAVISTAVSVISVNLLPVMEKKAEIEHNRKLKDEFLDIVKVYSTSKSENRSFSLSLGKSKTLFGQSTSSTLSVRESGWMAINLICNQTPIDENYRLFSLNLSTHSPLLPSQTIIFSEGGVIERQDGTTIERLSPDIRVEFNNTSNTLFLTMHNLASLPVEVSGNGYILLRLGKSSSFKEYVNCTGSISIRDGVFGEEWERKMLELSGPFSVSNIPPTNILSIDAPVNVSLEIRNFEISLG